MAESRKYKILNAYRIILTFSEPELDYSYIFLSFGATWFSHYLKAEFGGVIDAAFSSVCHLLKHSENTKLRLEWDTGKYIIPHVL